MDEFDGIKLGEIYTWENINSLDDKLQLWMCVDISKARPYGKTGKMFSNITYMSVRFGTYKSRHVDGSNKGRWITLNEML